MAPAAITKVRRIEKFIAGVFLFSIVGKEQERTRSKGGNNGQGEARS
jgi:hypothetical protein